MDAEVAVNTHFEFKWKKIGSIRKLKIHAATEIHVCIKSKIRNL